MKYHMHRLPKESWDQRWELVSGEVEDREVHRNKGCPSLLSVAMDGGGVQLVGYSPSLRETRVGTEVKIMQGHRLLASSL